MLGKKIILISFTFYFNKVDGCLKAFTGDRMAASQPFQFEFHKYLQEPVPTRHLLRSMHNLKFFDGQFLKWTCHPGTDSGRHRQVKGQTPRNAGSVTYILFSGGVG